MKIKDKNCTKYFYFYNKLSVLFSGGVLIRNKWIIKCPCTKVYDKQTYAYMCQCMEKMVQWKNIMQAMLCLNLPELIYFLLSYMRPQTPCYTFINSADITCCYIDLCTHCALQLGLRGSRKAMNWSKTFRPLHQSTINVIPKLEPMTYHIQRLWMKQKMDN